MNIYIYRTTRLFLTAVLFVFFAGAGWALPISNTITPGSYYDTFGDGSSYGTYTNSGDLLFVAAGNNEGSFFADLLEKMRNDQNFGTNFELVVTSSVGITEFDIEEESGRTGTWNVIPPVKTISFYAVKAGNAYAMYNVNPSDNSGSWSTYDIWTSGLNGTGGDGGLEISHFTGYNPSTPVPEPASMLLMGFGLLGFAALGRGKFLKNKNS